MTPPLNLCGPLTLQMLFAAQEYHLKEMYAALLASAMDTRTSATAHPSFVNVIQQLTPDEAKILNCISRIKSGYPSWNGNSKSDVWAEMRIFCASAGVEILESTDLYVDNLLRLRLLRYVGGSDAEYVPESDSHYGYSAPYVENREYEFIELTGYGRAFINVCVADSMAKPPA